ncbi:MAG: hypothetical protein ACI9OD_005238, partial [Limisphaerales bacterium]
SHNLFFLLAFLITFPGGRIDSQKLWDELVIRRQEKAYVHGHIHHPSHIRDSSGTSAGSGDGCCYHRSRSDA